MSDVVKIPDLRVGTYRHNKTGKLYEVLGIALDTETKNTLVIYKPLYDHEHGYRLFARPHAMFIETVELDGNTKARFEYVAD